LNQDVVRLSLAADVQQVSKHAEFGDKIKLKARIKIQNLLDHRRINSVTFQVKNAKWSGYEPNARGTNGKLMSAIVPWCPPDPSARKADQFLSEAVTYTNDGRGIGPNETDEVEVPYLTPPVDYSIEKASDLVQVALNEVVINTKINPANAIIKAAIAARKDNAIKNENYTSDFYSRGLFKIHKAPKKILGQKFDAFDEILDSTRSGILYLSETVSKLTYSKPNRLDEVIVASKVSGNDNGFSFNTAASAEFDFYANSLPFQVDVISPIAQNAFNYYKYQLEGTFFDDQNHQINKIKITPKRDTEPTFTGYIYIADDSWAIYAVDVHRAGNLIQFPALTSLSINQSFSFNSTDNRWTKNTQKLSFEAGMLQIKIAGGFTYVYSNYNFEPAEAKKTNKREVLRFELNANKKDVA
jgi:hypothetical protein